ncbi:MAG TPA: isocitrate lyase/phosphoenolpyruvate mutase family protein [Candidatus Limnocylindria bacterium]|nr:isocitrate lyase/phosphoenolpyruvate mutase family protein [Candidatus Limnocylindria bacterium]
MGSADWSSRRDRFRQLHESGLFVMPNPWDIGSARLLASMGFPALATTSLGHAASLGKLDQTVTRDELVSHVATLSAAVDLPLNVDAERCFADDLAGVAETVTLLAEAGASGCSIEDYDPAKGAIDEISVAAERVAAAAEAAHRAGMLLTGRAENALYGIDDIDDTIARLRAYRDAGADVVYAPRLTDAEQIRRVVQATDAPVNVLAMRHGPSVPELKELGVRRVSTGGPLARAAYGALRRAADELLGPGTSTYQDDALTSDDLARAFGTARMEGH